MATVTIFIYRARQLAPRGNCPVCRAWDGEESRVRENLPPAPNPACLEGQARCHCTIETREEVVPDGGGGDDGDRGGGGGGRGGGGDGGTGGGGGRNPFDDLEDRIDRDGEGDVSIRWDPDEGDSWWDDTKGQEGQRGRGG